MQNKNLYMHVRLACGVSLTASSAAACRTAAVASSQPALFAVTVRIIVGACCCLRPPRGFVPRGSVFGVCTAGRWGSCQTCLGA